MNQLAVFDTVEHPFVEFVENFVKSRSSHQSKEISETGERPWGFYEVLSESMTFKVKRIVVNEHSALSLQRHKYRSEHWVVVSGQAIVQIGEDRQTLSVNESTYIPVGRLHRLMNPCDKKLVVIEVQSGTYLGEDDIERFEDDYSRAQ